jgi:hypothetical protein
MMAFRRIADWLRTRRAPKLQDGYLVFHRDQTIALLDHPDIEDQFWVSFTLTALTTSSELLTLLYDDDSWDNRSLVIREEGSKRAVLFLLASDWEETEDEVMVHKVLKNKPRRILLRGPYRFDILRA